MHRALSHGVPAADKAAWVDGFFADGALLLIHDAELRGLVDGWVAELGRREFIDVLPLVRRTFGTFTPARAAADRRAVRRPALSVPIGRARWTTRSRARRRRAGDRRPDPGRRVMMSDPVTERRPG